MCRSDEGEMLSLYFNMVIGLPEVMNAEERELLCPGKLFYTYTP